MPLPESTKQAGAPLARGELLPHVDGWDLSGRALPYGEVWQRQHVLVFVLEGWRTQGLARTGAGPVDAEAAPALAYLTALRARVGVLQPPNATLFITEPQGRLQADSLIVADQWGEIAHVAHLDRDVSTWPSHDAVMEWTEFVRMKCPECPP